MLDHVDVKLALAGEAGESQVAAADVVDERHAVYLSVNYVELRVERVFEEKLDARLVAAQLAGEMSERCFSLGGRQAELKLLLEVGDGALKHLGPLRAAHAFVAAGQLLRTTHVLVGRAVHPDENPATRAILAVVVVNGARDALPAAQSKVADAEVRVRRVGKRLAQVGQEVVFYVVEDARHYRIST